MQKKSLWVGKLLSWLETMLWGCCCKHRGNPRKESTGEWEGALPALAGSGGAGTDLGLQGEPPTARLGLQPAWELGLWPCSRQVLPDHAVPKLVPPPSSARTVLFREARALGDAPGASGAFFIAQNCLDVVLVRFEQGAADPQLLCAVTEGKTPQKALRRFLMLFVLALTLGIKVWP